MHSIAAPSPVVQIKSLVINEAINSAQPKSAVKSNLSDFGPAFDKVLQDRIDTNRLGKTAERDQLQVKGLWLDIVSDKPIDAYTRDDMSLFSKNPDCITKIYWKSHADRQLLIREVIESRKNKRNSPQVFKASGQTCRLKSIR